MKPALEAAGLEPLRADEEQVGGIIHKPMFELFILCEYAVADLTLFAQPKTVAVDGGAHQCPPALIVHWARTTDGTSRLSLHSRPYGREH